MYKTERNPSHCQLKRMNWSLTGNCIWVDRFTGLELRLRALIEKGVSLCAQSRLVSNGRQNQMRLKMSICLLDSGENLYGWGQGKQNCFLSQWGMSTVNSHSVFGVVLGRNLYGMIFFIFSSTKVLVQSVKLLRKCTSVSPKIVRLLVFNDNVACCTNIELE